MEELLEGFGMGISTRVGDLLGSAWLQRAEGWVEAEIPHCPPPLCHCWEGDPGGTVARSILLAAADLWSCICGAALGQHCPHVSASNATGLRPPRVTHCSAASAPALPIGSQVQRWWGLGCQGSVQAASGEQGVANTWRDRWTGGWHPGRWNPESSHPRGSPRLWLAASVSSSLAGARACVLSAALLRSHFLPWLHLGCGHGRVLRAETKAAAGSGPRDQWGANLPGQTLLWGAR